MTRPQIWKPRCSPATKHPTTRHSVMAPTISSKSALGLCCPTAGSSNSQAKCLFPNCFTLCFLSGLLFTQPSDLQTPLISLRRTFPSLHMHNMCLLYSAGDKEKRGRGRIPLQEMLIGLFQPAPFRMYRYGPTNSTPGGDIPQINDYLRISHAAVPKAHGWLCRKDYCSKDEYR